MKIKTKSGFEWNVNEKKISDWRYVKAAARINSGNEAAILEGITFCIPFILGEDGEKALIDHVEENEMVDTEKMIAEFLEITQLIGEKTKKSKSSSSS